MIGNLLQIDLFSRIGLPVTDTDICQASSWDDAEAYCTSQSWGEVQLEERNKFTRKLNREDANALDNWNRSVQLVRFELQYAVEQRLERQHFVKNKKAVRDSVLWDFISIAMITTYRDIECSNFYSTVLAYYNLGHFPCGWKEYWPDGRLIVY